MKLYIVAVILCSVACSGGTVGNGQSKIQSQHDNPNINGVTVTDTPVTEINSPNPVTTTSPNSTTTPNTTTPITPITTPPSNGTTTQKPPITTTPTPKPTTPNTTTPTTPTTSKPPAPTTSPTTVTPSPAPTKAPITTTTLSPHHHDRQFDGPSFIGGIVLSLGLTAIGFVAFKFYKARTELNYHTL